MFLNTYQKLPQSLKQAVNSVDAFIGKSDTAPKPILRRLMIILFGMTSVFAVGFGILLVQQYQHHLHDMFQSQREEVVSDFKGLLNQQVSGMTMALQPIAANADVKKALREGDVNRLWADWHSVFGEMKTKSHLTHFYFFDKNRICLLRVHNPAKRGDLINRFTALEAEWTRKTASGIEIGPLGTFTLRVVQPVFDGTELIGYVEFGKEIEDVLKTLHSKTHNEIALIIGKKYLKRQAWEEGMRMLGRKGDWNQLQNDVIIYTSFGRLPDAFVSIAQHSRYRDDNSDQEVSSLGKRWQVSMTPVEDVSGKEIGSLMIMNDISIERSEFAYFIISNATVGMVLLGISFGFVFFLLRRTDRSVYRQQTSLQESEEKINTLAFFDQLTGLPNQVLLLDRLKQAMASSSRSESYGALLFIDLDNFKVLNDTLGHDVGDALLKQVAHRLSLCVREGDTVARFGGDEFVVVLSGLGLSETAAAVASEMVAEKILVSLNQSYLLTRASHRSTASIGVTLFKGDLSSIDDLMKQADLAMYKSKEAGRNGLSFFDPKMESVLKERTILEEDLRRGIDEKQFLLYYQAQVMENGYISGVEALIRWQHPQRGMVSPMEFIPVAEETGLILPLGDWILKTACEQLALWSHHEETQEMTIAVNVSIRQFAQKDFVDRVLSALEASGANAQRLKLELTESLLVHNVDNVIKKMVALKAEGISFSLDDFGTGYSSLSYLKRLPLDQLKIDQSFVRDILTDTNDAIICQSTIALAESMGLSVIAEGVETQEQRDMLAKIGCYAYQGYWFSRPLALEEFEVFHKRAMSEVSGENRDKK
ncbi:MAG: EAL domain-containing protein [Sulfuricurvum sp.]|nr:EAL domain-containing protein [Sulfuricurvum sp.]MDD5386106.1 EAL domain-containing protein [Sulfuricurvum sp.]